MLKTQAIKRGGRLLVRRYGLWPDEMGPFPDRPMVLSFDGELLRIGVGEDAYAVQASGVWVDNCQISLREFLPMPPRRLRGVVVVIQRARDSLAFNQFSLPALIRPEDDPIESTRGL